jgi:hypothetical protein
MNPNPDHPTIAEHRARQIIAELERVLPTLHPRVRHEILAGFVVRVYRNAATPPPQRRDDSTPTHPQS